MILPMESKKLSKLIELVIKLIINVYETILYFILHADFSRNSYLSKIMNSS